MDEQKRNGMYKIKKKDIKIHIAVNIKTWKEILASEVTDEKIVVHDDSKMMRKLLVNHHVLASYNEKKVKIKSV